MFEELIARLAGIRLAGEVPRVRSDFVPTASRSRRPWAGPRPAGARGAGQSWPDSAMVIFAEVSPLPEP